MFVKLSRLIELMVRRFFYSAKVILVAVLFVSGTFSASSVIAASDEAGGHVLEQAVGQYLVSMHYPFVFEAGRPIAMTFFIDKSDGPEQIRFTDLKISISKGGTDVFRANVARKAGLASGITFTFPDAGQYRVNSIFSNGSTTLAESSFDIRVQNDQAQRYILGFQLNKELLAGVFAGLLICGGIMLYVRWMKLQEVE